MKGRKIRIRQGVKGWLLALAMVLSLCSGWKQDVCAQQSQSSSSNLMQDVDTDKKGSIEILFDTMRDEPVANAEFTLYQVAAMVDRGGYTVLELTGGFEGCSVQLKNLTAQQSKDASAALLEYQRANHISGDTKRTDANGKISWTGLQTGLYLLVPGQMQKYRTDPSLVSIPKNSGSGVSAGRIRGTLYAGGEKAAEKDRDHRYTGNHFGAENTGEAASDRTAALADPGTFHSRSRIAVSWMVDRSKKKRLFQGSDGAWDPSGSRSSGDLRV